MATSFFPITAAPPPQGRTWHTGLDHPARWPLQWLHGFLSYTSCIPLVGNTVSRQSLVFAASLSLLLPFARFASHTAGSDICFILLCPPFWPIGGFHSLQHRRRLEQFNSLTLHSFDNTFDLHDLTTSRGNATARCLQSYW